MHNVSITVPQNTPKTPVSTPTSPLSRDLQNRGNSSGDLGKTNMIQLLSKLGIEAIGYQSSNKHMVSDKVPANSNTSVIIEVPKETEKTYDLPAPKDDQKRWSKHSTPCIEKNRKFREIKEVKNKKTPSISLTVFHVIQ